MSDLPKDWEAVASKDGTYYWHTVTGEVTWKKPKQPSKPKPPPPPPLPNSPIVSEPPDDLYNYTDDYTHAFPNYQPVQTCYQNVVLLKEPSQDDISPSKVKTVDNYENVELIQRPSSQDEINKPESTDKPTLDRYRGPSDSEDPYTCVNKAPDRKSNFRHSAVKRKLSNNVEELVITREKVDVNGADKVPDIPIRSPSIYDDEEICNNLPVSQVYPEDSGTQFAVPFSDQYREVDKPVLINDPHSSLTKLPSYDKEQDPLLTNECDTSTTQTEVNNQSRDSGIGLSSSSRVNSYQSNSPLKSTITERPGTLYENVELPFEKNVPTTPTKALTEDKTLPEGWKQVDSDNGDVYYWHIESGATQWNFPEGQPLSPMPVILSEKISESSQPSTPLSTFSLPKVPLPEHTNVRSFSAWLIDIQDINSNELKHGNCTNIIENCIQSVSDRLQGDQELEQQVVLQVSPGVLKELDAQTSSINKAYSITRIRAWGCSRENSRYFAYIIRHSKSQVYKCNIYKCASSAKSLTLALKDFSGKSASDSSTQSPSKDKRQSTVSIGENESCNQQIDEGEQYQRFNVTFLGSIKVTEESGIELICSSLEKLKNQPANWIEAIIDIYTTHFIIVGTKTGEVLTETRVRFLSFLGLSNDDSMCGYITGDDDTYFCLGFRMEPNSIQLSLAMKDACESRFQRVCKGIPDDSIRSNSSSLKKGDSTILNKAEVASEKIGGYFKSKMSKVSKQVGHKLQRTSSAKTIYGTYQVQLYGSAQVPIDNDKKAVEEAISYLESQSNRLTNPHVIEFQITQGGFIFLDKEKRKFTKKVFSITNIRYCLKKGHSVAFVVMNKSGLFDAYAFGEINTNASVIIETIQTAVNENV
ncbi:hypothetical protein LOD99_13763 [Oopsacas minuta]|uniref:Uncharacterized protein n=1 Tax=Oopsacas minuta TaxID=111878 RepID=A0AAV7KI01_9METZ|nr:hypothetical protein LOD99_13763 [Oopsacas minuta]